MAIPVCWNKPQKGLIKLNLDRAFIGNLGEAGGGGIIRHSQGKWVKGYMRHIGTVLLLNFKS